MASIKASNLNINTQDSEQAFIDTILLYSKNLKADAVSHDLQVTAFLIWGIESVFSAVREQTLIASQLL